MDKTDQLSSLLKGYKDHRCYFDGHFCSNGYFSYCAKRGFFATDETTSMCPHKIRGRALRPSISWSIQIQIVGKTENESIELYLSTIDTWCNHLKNKCLRLVTVSWIGNFLCIDPMRENGSVLFATYVKCLVSFLISYLSAMAWTSS